MTSVVDNGTKFQDPVYNVRIWIPNTCGKAVLWIRIILIFDTDPDPGYEKVVTDPDQTQIRIRISPTAGGRMTSSVFWT